MIYVVVAHPDDEALSFGGAISLLRDSGADVFLVSLTNASHPVRAKEFADFAARAGCGHAMLDYPDGGFSHFPSSAVGFDSLLSEHGMRLNHNDSVITHSPEGNERRHPQHIQAWTLMRRWCAEHAISIGFFAEDPLPELHLRSAWTSVANRVALSKASPNFAVLARHVATTLSAKPLHPGSLRERLSFRRWFEPTAHIRFVIRFEVDVERKQSLLAAYGSQIVGLREYASFSAKHEYLHLLGRRSLAAFPWATQ